MGTFNTFIINLLNTDFIVTLVVTAAVAYITKFLASAQGLQWKKYEGLAITAVKMAELAVPDDTTNKGAKRLDTALKFFLDKYESSTGVKPNDKAIGEISSLLSLVHEKLEADDTLPVSKATGE